MRDAAAFLHAWVVTVQDRAILLLHPAGLVASWNAGAARILGYAEAEVLGKHFSSFLTPEDRGPASPVGRSAWPWPG